MGWIFYKEYSAVLRAAWDPSSVLLPGEEPSFRSTNQSVDPTVKAYLAPIHLFLAALGVVIWK